MKKFLPLIALLTFTFSLQSGLGASSRHLSAGDAVPVTTLSNPSVTIKLGAKDAPRTLVAFWSASDAKSRQDLAKYSDYLASHPDAARLTAVCLDDDAELAMEVARRDGVAPAAVFVATAQQTQQIVNGYGLEGAYGAVLIGHDGRVEAFNPSLEML